MTACDAASSHGWARVVVGEVTAALVVAFLLEVVVPSYRAAGWTLRRVLTDNGTEFKGGFGAACARRGIRHTRTKPRHAWTNGFVERLQGTILHEHWRIAFRRHYFTRLRALQQSLDHFLAFYNTQRPHQALEDATPAEWYDSPQEYGGAPRTWTAMQGGARPSLAAGNHPPMR